MHYVILRDDDTHALTPIEALEELFRPFLERGLPINLAVIPQVSTSASLPNGEREPFLMDAPATPHREIPIAENSSLVSYLLGEPHYHLVQHGYTHHFHEFLSTNRQEVVEKLEQGKARFQEAGFPPALAFVAPQDKLSKVSLYEAARRFPILSTSWFERKQIPFPWWPSYLLKKWRHQPHWRAGGTLFLSRPVQEISYLQPYDTILDRVKASIRTQKLTIVLTHWWEFFRKGERDPALISILHQFADHLATSKDIQVLSFSDLLTKERERNFPLF